MTTSADRVVHYTIKAPIILCHCCCIKMLSSEDVFVQLLTYVVLASLIVASFGEQTLRAASEVGLFLDRLLGVLEINTVDL